MDAEYASVSNIYRNYKWILENGLENPETGLESMLKEMKEEGMDQILIEIHKQYDIWKKEKGKKNEPANR